MYARAGRDASQHMALPVGEVVFIAPPQGMAEDNRLAVLLVEQHRQAIDEFCSQPASRTLRKRMGSRSSPREPAVCPERPSRCEVNHVEGEPPVQRPVQPPVVIGPQAIW